MSFLISSRFRRWLVLVIALPILSWTLAKVADRIRARRGESAMTKMLRAPQNWRQRRAARAA